MNTLTLISLVLVLLIAGTTWQASRKRFAVKKKHIQGIKLLNDLRQILAFTQRHRGLTTANLKGDQSQLDQILDVENFVNSTCKKIESSSQWLKYNDLWLDISTQWQRLVAQYKQKTVENNLEEHNKLIQIILYLIEDTADEYGLLNIESRYSFSLEFFWKDLLETTEYMGQARALGMGIAASGKCDSLERIRLNYLIGKVSEQEQRLLQRLNLNRKEQANIHSLLECMKHTLPLSLNNLSTDDFFRLATSAIDTVYAKYDEALNQLAIKN